MKKKRKKREFILVDQNGNNSNNIVVYVPSIPGKLTQDELDLAHDYLNKKYNIY